MSGDVPDARHRATDRPVDTDEPTIVGTSCEVRHLLFRV